MVHDIQRGFKVLTHHFCSPLQGGGPVWDGIALPHALPMVALDTGDHDCGVGWSYCSSIKDALLIGGLWPAGRPSTVFEVQAGADAIQRGKKRRSSMLKLVRQCTPEEIGLAMAKMSIVLSPHADHMCAE